MQLCYLDSVLTIISLIFTLDTKARSIGMKSLDAKV
jgi:hypothetical protein